MCDYAYDCRQYGLYTCAVTLVVQTLKSRVTGSQQLVAANIASRPSIAIYAWCTSRSLFFHRKTHSTNLSSPLFQYYILQLSDLALSTYVRATLVQSLIHTVIQNSVQPRRIGRAYVRSTSFVRTYGRPKASYMYYVRLWWRRTNNKALDRPAGPLQLHAARSSVLGMADLSTAVRGWFGWHA
jgi:hypothetical protein